MNGTAFDSGYGESWMLNSAIAAHHFSVIAQMANEVKTMIRYKRQPGEMAQTSSLAGVVGVLNWTRSVPLFFEP